MMKTSTTTKPATPKPRTIPPVLPHLDQYSGVWALRDTEFAALTALAAGMDLRAHLATVEARRAGGDTLDFAPQVTIDNASGIATVVLSGVSTKYGSSLTSGYSTLAAREAIRSLGRKDSVKGVVLLIDSPGGSWNGTDDLARDVAALNTKKPVAAYIEDNGHSAAYYIASQAGRVVSNQAASVGSIGTFAVVRDLSEMYAKDGVKTYVIGAGKFKGMGTPGTEITDEQRAEMQREVDEVNEHFLAAVARGRKMPLERVRALADGRAHGSAEAKSLGLIDDVSTLEAEFTRLVSLTGNTTPSTKGTPKMTDAEITKLVTETVTAAVSQAMKPDPATFVRTANTGTPTITESVVQRAHSGKLTITENVGRSYAGEHDDPIAEFNSRVAKLTATGVARLEAVARVATHDHDLHEQYLLATNAGRGIGAERVIREKYSAERSYRAADAAAAAAARAR